MNTQHPGETVLAVLEKELSASGLTHCRVESHAKLALYESDLVFAAAALPIAALQPSVVTEVPVLLRACARAGATVEVRGAGLSYSGGYLAQNDHTVLLDTSLLRGISAHAGSERVVCVEAGTTWLDLDNWLKGSGRRVGLLPPISGSLSTISGSLRQGMPSDMSAVLAVEVVTPEGEVLRTGALAVDEGFSPLWRGQGPDLTGLFLGDCGVFGVLTRAWLRVDPEPEARGFFACAVPDPALFPALMDALEAPPATVRGYCFDPGRSAALRAQPFREQVSVALRVLARQRGVIDRVRGLLDLFKTAAAVGDGSAGDLWGVHLIFEGSSGDQLAQLELRARQFARRHNAPIMATTVAQALASRPYSVRGVLGADYERWAPVSAIFDRSRAAKALPLVNQALKRSCDEAGVPGLTGSMLILAVTPDHIVLEPMLLWPSTLYPLHRSLVPKARTVSTDNEPACDRAVLQSRAELAVLMDELGGQHVQLGRFYEYLGRLQPVNRALVETLKAQLDPDHRHAPGSLGLRGGA